MGYILLSAIMRTCERWKRLLLSYDIACKFCVHFVKRMEDFPVEFRIDVTETEVLFRIPKFHLPAHGDKCQTVYSFNFTTGVGRTYGEIIESNWSETNTAALQTREQSFAHRQEFLDLVFGSINWTKITKMGKFSSVICWCYGFNFCIGPQLSKSLNTAVLAEFHHRTKYDTLRRDFPPDTIERWDAMIEAWDRDQQQPNPYDDPAPDRMSLLANEFH